MSSTGGQQQNQPTTPEHVASHPMASRGTRETIESIVIAIILAFLFRGFEAEAFVIPTGSMATTLMGRHIDVECPQCGYRYRTGASSEEGDEQGGGRSVVVAATCPICRHSMPLDYFNNSNHRSFTGDRILVNKFAYDLAEPQRWDIIVFKYPGNAKQNFIKRLVGLPNEAIMLRHGDVYTLSRKELDRLRGENASHREIVKHFKIARKPSYKLKAMLQLVDDSRHIAVDLKKAKWPSRWQSWQDGSPRKLRTCEKDEEGFTIGGDAKKESWLRYNHFVPTSEQWEALGNNDDTTWVREPNGGLISDFYAYNTVGPGRTRSKDAMKTQGLREYDPNAQPPEPAVGKLGANWVGDLAMECWVEVKSDSGELLLDLVEGGVRYECRIEIGGHATLRIDDENDAVTFDGKSTESPKSKKKVVSGKGKYRLRFTNVDNELLLWVNERVVEFDKPTSYDPGRDVVPDFRTKDRPNDLQPVGIGAKNASLKITRLRILRDIYYIATRGEQVDDDIYSANDDYDNTTNKWNDANIRKILDDPLSDNPSNNLFESRKSVFIPLQPDGELDCLGPDQFFPMGDNSPSSKDARLWSVRGGPDPYVDRKLLIGKAVFVYWPHSWRPFWPNFKRMRFIR